MAEAAIMLDAAGCLHDLRLLLHSAPETVRIAFFEEPDECFRGAERALQKAAWCEEWARRDWRTAHERESFEKAAALLRMAAPMLPGHAPPEVPEIRQGADIDYSRSVAKADRAYRRRRR